MDLVSLNDHLRSDFVDLDDLDVARVHVERFEAQILCQGDLVAIFVVEVHAQSVVVLLDQDVGVAELELFILLLVDLVKPL